MNENQVDNEKPRPYLGWSYALLALALASHLLTGVILDSALAPLSLAAQRWLVGLTLILPALLGVLTGILALQQPERRPLLAVTGIILNGAVALFFMALLGIAG